MYVYSVKEPFPCKTICSEVVEAHCTTVNSGQIDLKHILYKAESIATDYRRVDVLKWNTSGGNGKGLCKCKYLLFKCC